MNILMVLLIIMCISAIFILHIIHKEKNILIYAAIGICLMLLLVSNYLGNNKPNKVKESSVENSILNGNDHSVLDVLEGRK